MLIFRYLLVCLTLSCAYVSVGRADVMIGAFVPHDGFSRYEISKLNSALPKQLAHIQLFTTFSHSLSGLQQQTSNIVQEGAMPLITWMPIDLQRPDDNLLPEITLGEWDAYLDRWVLSMHEWILGYETDERPRIAIRFAHEFNADWYPYSNDPMHYVPAWQHVHNKVSESGLGDYVDWVWSLSRTNVDSHNDITLYYPGDEFVDWTSIDGYNWGSNYHFSKWSSFREVFAKTYITLLENYPDKPIWIAEIGCAEPSDEPNQEYGMDGDNADSNESKSAWITEMLSDLETHFPAVRALTLFNVNKELNWSITEEGNTGLDAFSTGIESDHFTSDYLTVKTTGLGLGYSTNRVKKDLLASVQSLKNGLNLSVERFAQDLRALSKREYESEEESTVALVEPRFSAEGSQENEALSEQGISGIDQINEVVFPENYEPQFVTLEEPTTDTFFNLDEISSFQIEEAVQEEKRDEDLRLGETDAESENSVNTEIYRSGWFNRMSSMGSSKVEEEITVGSRVGQLFRGSERDENSAEAVELVRQRVVTAVAQIDLGELEESDSLDEQESEQVIEGFRHFYDRDRSEQVRNMNFVGRPTENIVGNSDLSNE